MMNWLFKKKKRKVIKEVHPCDKGHVFKKFGPLILDLQETMVVAELCGGDFHITDNATKIKTDYYECLRCGKVKLPRNSLFYLNKKRKWNKMGDMLLSEDLDTYNWVEIVKDKDEIPKLILCWACF